ncbi:MAG: lysophospholipid acyltransferase family protein [Bacteroides sp.]
MKRLRDAILYGLFYAFTWGIAILPRPLFYAFSDFVAFLLASVLRYRRKVVHQNLERSFPELSSAERRRIAVRFYRHLSDLILESIFLLHASPRRMMKRCTYTNIELLLPYYEQGRSVVIAAAHIANWEFLTTAAPLLRHHMLNVYKPLHNKRIERFITYARERLGGTAVPMQHILRAILRFEKQGQPTLIGLISDQTPPWGNHFWVDFLHQDTMVYTGVERIARQFNAPVFFCQMTRVRRGYYSVTLKPITDTPNDEPEHAITTRYMQLLEATIRENPPCWLWSHKRWKHHR